jgi:hypothetical protein
MRKDKELEKMIEDEGALPEYGYSSMVEALEEYESAGGWFRHCQMRAAIIVSNNFISDDEKETEYVYNRYSRHLELGLKGWEKMWHYGEDTHEFIHKKMKSWAKDYTK